MLLNQYFNELENYSKPWNNIQKTYDKMDKLLKRYDFTSFEKFIQEMPEEFH